ncbi:MAG: PilW family protein [Arenicellales bacterium]
MTARARYSRGFSLTELLVAMVIGLLLLAGLVTLMVNSKKNYATQDYSARLQENARFAMRFLSYDIRMAGYYGCSNDIINDTNTKAITATDSSSGNPDSITITYGEPYNPGTEITLDPGAYDPYGTPDTLYLSTAIPQEWTDSDTLVIGDCGSASVAGIAKGGIHATTNSIVLDLSHTTSGSLGRIYDPNAKAGGAITIRRLVSNDYTIATGQSHIPTLKRNGQELVEGVENIQLLYQGLTGGAFVAGSSLPANVAAVQLAALVRSVSNENLTDRQYGSGAKITEDKGQYTLLGQNVSSDTPTIRGQRHVFNSMLMVRNRPL